MSSAATRARRRGDMWGVQHRSAQPSRITRSAVLQQRQVRSELAIEVLLGAVAPGAEV